MSILIVIDGVSLTGHKFDGRHPDVFLLGTVNNNSFRQTQLVYYYLRGNMF